MNELFGLGKFDNEESRRVIEKALSEKEHPDSQIAKIKKIEEEISKTNRAIDDLKKNAELAGKTEDYEFQRAQIKLIGENYKRYKEIERITDQINDFPMLDDEKSEEIVNIAMRDSHYNFDEFNKKIEDLNLEIELLDNLIISKEKSIDEKTALLIKKRKLEKERSDILS